ncbi:MAG: abortive infection family protein [Rhodoglobus sp.]
MRDDASDEKIVQAVVKTIVATFDRSDWMELALLTGELEFVTNHPRLLRSLDWNDPDYRACVIEAVPIVLGGQDGNHRRTGAKYTNLSLVEEYIKLPDYLRQNEPALYNDLYAGEDEAVVDDLQAAATALGLEDVDLHAARIRRGLRDDPGLAIGASKELLETVLKAILGLRGNGPETIVDVPKLIKDVNVRLGLDANGHRGAEPGADHRRKIFGSLASIVNSTAELRNAGFGTGHGGVARPELDVATARLVVSSAVAVATFYIEAHATDGRDGA